MIRIPETPRLRFRRLTLDDEDQLFEMFADPYARTFYPEMVDPGNVRRWIEWNLRNYEEHGFGLWAVELKESGEFIGDCGLTYQDVAGTPELEIGYHIVQSQRRNGYALEAARACLDFGFTQPSPRSARSFDRRTLPRARSRHACTPIVAS
jgi:RimJ/RimL family protein N-acetyltransferase